MIAAKVDIVERLGALLGVSESAPFSAPTGDGIDFAGMLAAVAVVPEAEPVQPMAVADSMTVSDAQLVSNEDADPVTLSGTKVATVAGLKLVAPVPKPQIKISVAPLGEPALADLGLKSQTDMVTVDDPAPLKPSVRTNSASQLSDPLPAAQLSEEEGAADEPTIALDSEVRKSIELSAAPIVAPFLSLLLMPDVTPETLTQRAAKPRSVERLDQHISPPVSDVRIAAAAPVLFDTVKPVSGPRVETTEVTAAAPLDQRALLPMTVAAAEKPTVATPDRLASFTPLIADAVRDLVSIAHDKDVRFNVRPETLGPVAVTIQRGEAGLGLRLGVETPAAVQAVRQAEPMLNDMRGNTPFVQVTVDLNSPEQRGRPARTAVIPKRDRDAMTHQIEPKAAMPTGRFA